MNKVVDSNYLLTPSLEAYLSASPDHHVILTNVITAEARTIPMSILARYPSQVITLAPEETPHDIAKFRAALTQLAIMSARMRDVEGIHWMAGAVLGNANPDGFAFRWAVCAYVYARERIEEQNIGQLSDQKLANDMVDISVAAYATFHDGLLSFDRRANHVYASASQLLKML